MENGAKVNGADTPCLLQQCGQTKVIVARVGLKLLSQRRQTNIAPRHFSQLPGVPGMALGSGTVAIHIPDFRDSKTLAAGQFSSMTPKSNSRISVTTADMSSEPAHPSLFEKKTNSSASAGQTLEKNLDRGIMLRVAVGESLARPSQLGCQVATFSPKRPTSFAAFAKSLDRILTRLDWGNWTPSTFPPERVAPSTTPPVVPASAAPPASSGILALLTAWPVACPASFPAFPTPSPTALTGLAFELPFREGLERALVRFARDCAAFGFRAPFAFAVLAVEVFPELDRFVFLFFVFV